MARPAFGIALAGMLAACGTSGSGPASDSPRTTPSAHVAEAPRASVTPTGRRLACELDYACALTETGSVRCWGEYPLLDTGRGGPAPATVAGVGPAVAISADFSAGCLVLADRTGECWGSMPPPPEEGPWPDEARVSLAGPLRSIATHEAGRCALSEDGSLRCGGTHGGLLPVAVGGQVAEIAVSHDHRCARTEDGRVFCWGSNLSGQLGDGTNEDRRTPTPVVGLTDAIRIGLGNESSCALRRTGAVVCWGAGRSGELGREPNQPDASPEPLEVPGVAGATDLFVGVSQACALDAVGALLCWGSNAFGQLGDGTTLDHHVAAAVPGLPPVVEAAFGGRYACALDGDEQVWCWGTGASGQVLDGATPLGLVEVSGVTATRIFAGDDWSCALETDRITCWGMPDEGGLAERARHRVVAIPRPSQITALGGGGRAMSVLWSDGRMQASMTDRPGEPMGEPRTGVLSASISGTSLCTVDRRGAVACARVGMAPRPLEGVDDAIAVHLAPRVCAVRRGGQVTCWDSWAGAPEPLADVDDAVDVIAQPGPCIRTREGEVRCHDGAAWPQRGLTSLVATHTHVCAVGGGRVYCAEQTSMNGRRSLEAPEAVPGLEDVTSLVAGSAHLCALREGGRVACWGHNRSGQLGVPPSGLRPSPAVVTRLRSGRRRP